MTPEQKERCAKLSRRIAELDPDWAKPGMACRGRVSVDGELRPLSFRLIDGNIWAPTHTIRCLPFSEDSPCDDAVWLRLVLRCGPDYTDDTTVGAVLRSIGPLEYSSLRTVCQIRPYDGVAVNWSFTWVEAVLTARVAQLEAR